MASNSGPDQPAQVRSVIRTIVLRVCLRQVSHAATGIVLSILQLPGPLRAGGHVMDGGQVVAIDNKSMDKAAK